MTVVVPTDGLEAIPQSYEQLVFERRYSGTDKKDAHWLHPYNYPTPDDAAWLLCGWAPGVPVCDATPTERAKELKRLLSNYEFEHPARRSWRDWHAVAREIKADYHKGFDYFFDVLHRPSTDTVAVELTQVVTESASNTTTTPRNVMKKKAFIDEVLYEWPTVEADIGEASRNGLKVEAHAGKHAEWDVDRARQWAKKNGKLKAAHAESHPHAYWPGGVMRHTLKD